MDLIYCRLIMSGRRTFKSVPARIKERVRKALIDLDLEDLIIE